MGHVDTVIHTDPLPVRTPQPLPAHAGKRYFVTGAARGLGRSVAELLIAQGASVWLGDVLADELATTSAELGARGFTAFNVADEESALAAVADAVAGLGGIDGVANVAGIAPHHPPLEIPREAWHRIYGVNVFGMYTVSQAVAQAIIAAGSHGSIVNVASEAGKVGHIDSLAYSTSKAAVISLSRTLSAALAEHDINVNCVCPGGMATTMLRDVAEVYGAKLGRSAEDVLGEMAATQLRRLTQTEEVAQAISFLLSDAAMAIRGQAINVDAGETPY